MGDDPNYAGLELDNGINEVLRSAMEIIESRVGENQSLKWSRETYMQINRIVAGSGPRGILYGPDAITRIMHRDDLDEVIESLEFLFHDGYKPIATRSYKYGVQPNHFEGFESEVNGKQAPIYSELLTNLQELCEATDFVESDLIAYLAARSFYKLPITFPQTTGTTKPLSGGTLYQPNI